MSSPPTYTYIYLEPELKQSSLIAASPLIFLVIILVHFYYHYKRLWKTNQCDGDLAHLAPLFGSTTREWAQKCLHAPLEGSIYALNENISKLQAEVKRMSPFEPALKAARAKIMGWSTNIKLATNQLKRQK